MRVLFVHRHFPAQFGRLAAALAADRAHEVAFVSEQRGGEIAGIRRELAAPIEPGTPAGHAALSGTELAIRRGEAAFEAMRKLATNGFAPDVVYAHAGFGPGLFAKDAFPGTPLAGYFEWFYRAERSDADFLDGQPVPAEEARRIRLRNAVILTEFAAADARICPTRFQREQFPGALAEALQVVHDGVDTDFFSPNPEPADEMRPLALRDADAVVTYATRGMEPYRGFPQFMRAAASILRRRPRTHVVIAGSDRVVYGRARQDGRGYKDALIEELGDVDRGRLHFVGALPYAHYRALLRMSSAHVYLTVPFVLSWSLLEAMATGCPIVASDTAPVREAIVDGREGLLVDFFSPDEIADRVLWLLEDRGRAAALGRRARAAVQKRFALARALPRQVALLAGLAGKRK